MFETASDERTSFISLEFSDDSYFETKAVLELPDTNDFILKVSDASGKAVYNGAYGDSPERLKVTPGSYTINVASGTFSVPAFDSPLFGDEQCVVVRSGENCRVRLLCRQLNSGVRLKIDRNFLTSYPSAALLLKSQAGSLLYSYSERRDAYFHPGIVNLIMTENGTDRKLYSKNLAAQEMLVLTVNAGTSSSDDSGQDDPSLSSTSFKVSVDSARTWLSESCTIGGGSSGGGNDSADALTIAKAKDRIGEEGVWVTGYIVGGDLTSSSMSFDAPFKSKTNLVIGPRSSTDEKESCMSVNLPTGELRNALNLVDHPELVGRRIAVKGDIVSAYYGIPGIKNLSEYTLK